MCSVGRSVHGIFNSIVYISKTYVPIGLTFLYKNFHNLCQKIVKEPNYWNFLKTNKNTIKNIEIILTGT